MSIIAAWGIVVLLEVAWLAYKDWKKRPPAARSPADAPAEGEVNRQARPGDQVAGGN